jgi:hypothetical protein
MKTKLTLRLNKKTIERAKKYTRKNKKSLSARVENYFNAISGGKVFDEINISPNVLELSGIISIPEGNIEIKSDET